MSEESNVRLFRVRFESASGTGMTLRPEVEEGTTINAFLERYAPDTARTLERVRVNGKGVDSEVDPLTHGQILKENDRIVIVPTKPAGAA